MLNKQESIKLKFELIFMFVDLKVALLIVMLARLYKETILLISVVDPKQKVLIADVLNHVWQKAGHDMLLWIFGAILGDIFIKAILRHLHD